MDGTPTGTNSMGKNEHGSNGNEVVLHTPQILRTRSSQPTSF